MRQVIGVISSSSLFSHGDISGPSACGGLAGTLSAFARH